MKATTKLAPALAACLLAALSAIAIVQSAPASPQGKGAAPRDAPLTAIAGDRAYRVDVALEIEPGAAGSGRVHFRDFRYRALD